MDDKKDGELHTNYLAQERINILERNETRYWEQTQGIRSKKRAEIIATRRAQPHDYFYS